MNKKTSGSYRIESDRDIRDSGLQGGKIIGEKLSLFSFIIGIPLLALGAYALLSMLFGWGFPKNNATILGVLLVIAIGLLMTIGGYNLYRTRHG